MYRGLFIEKRSDWDTIASKYTIKDVIRTNFPFNDLDIEFIKMPLTMSKWASTIKEAMEQIDNALD
jgi:hypothetical protein